jgi:hypothetical protein
VDGRSRYHGYVRTSDGTITTFDATKAPFEPAFINDEGVIAGTYGTPLCPVDARFCTGSFVRASDGTITIFHVAGNQFTVVDSINAKGVITGYYGGNSAGGSFVRTSDGTITTFDLLEAVSINDEGTIAGDSVDERQIRVGFVRDADGKVVTFQYPPRGNRGTLVFAINKSGVIVGSYEVCIVSLPGTCSFDSGNAERGYVRTP